MHSYKCFSTDLVADTYKNIIWEFFIKDPYPIPRKQYFLLNWKTLLTTFSTSSNGCCIFGCTNGVKCTTATSTYMEKKDKFE